MRIGKVIDFVPFIGILFLILIYISYKYYNPILVTIFSSGLIILGVEMLSNGISLFNNFITYSLGIIYLCLGAYMWIVELYNEFERQEMI